MKADRALRYAQFFTIKEFCISKTDFRKHAQANDITKKITCDNHTSPRYIPLFENVLALRKQFSVNRIVGPTLPQSGIDALTSDSNTPPMDLFKSIFASDEELSSSSLSEDEHDGDGDDDGDKHREGSLAVSSNVKQSNTVSLSNGNSILFTSKILTIIFILDQSGLFKGHSLFSHLFEPDGDMHAPLSGLTRITTQPRDVIQKVDTPSQNNTNPDLLYGPDLPPNFSSAYEQINPTPSACDQGKPSTVPPSDILFVVSYSLLKCYTFEKFEFYIYLTFD
ncbi:unnamed protein product [Trichobilharzia regenti]|nr:unnamed protein product [Trichobilharzia regenti]